jgi:hypothetical protein
MSGPAGAGSTDPVLAKPRGQSMARPRDTLRPYAVVVDDLLRRYHSGTTALQLLNEDLRSGARIAFHDGRELPRNYWARASIKFDRELSPYIECDGVEVHGQFLIADPVATPLRVELIAVTWFTKLLREMFSLLRGRAEPADLNSTAASGEARSPEEWLALIQPEMPQRPDEGPSDYSRRLYENMPARFRERWRTWDTLRVTLAKQRQANPH